MDWLEIISRNFFYPLREINRGWKLPPVLKQLEKSQFYPPEQIRDLQWQKLKDLLKYVYRHNRFYRTRFEQAGATPEDIKSFDDYARLPLVTKDDLRNSFDDLLSDGQIKEEMMWRRTGGSTGVPVQVYWDQAANTFKSALTYRHDRWAGYRPGMKRAALWGDTSQELSNWDKLYHSIYTRMVTLDTLVMTDEQMDKFVGTLRDFRPRMLFGHGHSLYFFARYLADHNINDIKFEGIISSAETLPPAERAVVEELFGKIVFDRYGCEEVSVISSECEAREGLHIAAEGIYVELLEGDETEPGRLVITDLVNHGTPLLRYEIGDLATIKHGACPCGRGLPRLGKVAGRVTDILFTPEGNKISGVSILDTFTIHIPGFKQVQIVQDKIDELTFKIVRGDKFSEESLAVLAEKIPKFFGPAMRHRVEYVEEIPKTRRGKYQFSICNLNEEDIPIR